MEEKTIAEKVIDVVAEHSGCNIQGVKLSSRLNEDLQLDSLDTVELAMALEDEFDLTIPDEDIVAGFKTVAGLVDYMAKRVNG